MPFRFGSGIYRSSEIFQNFSTDKFCLDYVMFGDEDSLKHSWIGQEKCESAKGHFL